MKTLVVILVVTMLAAGPVAAQTSGVDTAAVWRTFAAQVEVGAPLKVRLRNGQTFKGTLVQAQPDVLLVQPKTRLAVPVQPVAYDAIVSLERESRKGTSAGKAVAIGVAAGAGAVLGVLFVIFATLSD